MSDTALAQIHCHQQATIGIEATGAALRAAGLNAQILDAGCCGMAGSFGFDKIHYEVSLRVGERVLLPAVRHASPDTLIVADGFSCREQIRQRTPRKAYHFAELLSRQTGTIAYPIRN